MNGLYEAEESHYYPEDIDDILDSMIEEAEDYDFAERAPGRPRTIRPGVRPRPGAIRPGQRPGMTPRRSPAPQGGAMAQPRDAASRADLAAMQARLTKVEQGMVSLAAGQARTSVNIATLDRARKVDGALDLASSFRNGELDVFQLVRGTIKGGFVGEPTGAFGNPVLIGVIGLLLNNPNLLDGILNRGGSN